MHHTIKSQFNISYSYSSCTKYMVIALHSTLSGLSRLKQWFILRCPRSCLQLSLTDFPQISSSLLGRIINCHYILPKSHCSVFLHSGQLFPCFIACFQEYLLITNQDLVMVSDWLEETRHFLQNQSTVQCYSTFHLVIDPKFKDE